MSKRGLLLCNLARQGINASSSEKQELSKVDQSEMSKKDCEMVPQQDNSKHNENLDENDFRLLQWLNDNQRIDYVEESLENLKNISENDEETTKELKEKTDNIEETIDTFKEATDNVKEIINCDTGGNTTGETSQLRQDNATTGSESDGSDFSGTDTDRDKDFVPDKRRKRKIVLSSNSSSSSNSSTSSSSSSSTTSSSSDSNSTKSKNLPKTPDQTITQLLDAQVSPPIVQQIATQDPNNTLNTEMRPQFECEFQNTPIATKAKKKPRNPAGWKQNIRKALKNTGQEHSNSSGKLIPAKKNGPPCTEKCLFSCSKRISTEDRLRNTKAGL